MKVARRFAVSLLVLLLGAPALQAQLPEPVLVVSCPSYNTVMAKLGYLGKLAGQPQLKQQAEGMIALFTQGQGIPGLDKDKPCGAVLFAAGAGQQPDFIAFVPVADAGAVAKLFNVPLQPDPQRQGVLTLPLPQGGQQLYLKSQNGWTWAVSNAQLLDKLPQDPSGWVGTLAKQYDLAVQFRMSAIPQQLRQQITALMQMGLEAGLEGASQQQRQAAQIQLQQVKDLLESLDTLLLGVQIDEEKKLLALDMEVVMSPGSTFGQVLSSIKVVPTRMLPFAPEGSVLRVLASATFGQAGQDYALKQLPAIKQMLQTQLEQGKGEFPDEESYQTVKQLFDQGFDLYTQLIRSGKVDVGMSMENQDGKLFCNFAVHLPQGHKADQLIRSCLELLQGEGVPVQFNAAAQDGVTYHRISFGGSDAQLDALFGEDASLVLATGPQGCYLALGPKALEQLQQRVAASRTQTPRQMKHYEEIILSVRPLVDLIQQHAPNPALVLITGALPKEEKAQVRLLADIEGTKERIRLEVDESLIRLLIQLGSTAGGLGPGPGLPGGPPSDF